MVYRCCLQLFLGVLRIMISIVIYQCLTFRTCFSVLFWLCHPERFSEPEPTHEFTSKSRMPSRFKSSKDLKHTKETKNYFEVKMFLPVFVSISNQNQRLVFDDQIPKKVWHKIDRMMIMSKMMTMMNIHNWQFRVQGF